MVEPLAPRRGPPLIVRDADAGTWFELFCITAVATILVTRAFLALAGYPQLGGRNVHIAHVLWGGLGMAAAVVLLLVSLSRRAKPAAALLGGAGFGLFIDELGKFVTRDNDYFFQPAVALIYIVFVGMFLLVRTRLSARGLDAEERLANVLWWTGDLALGDLDPAERAHALQFLEPLDPADPRVVALRALLAQPGLVPAPTPTPRRRIVGWIRQGGEALLAHRAFSWTLALVLIAQALWAIGSAVMNVHVWWSHARLAAAGAPVDPIHIGWARLLAGVASGVFVLVGAVRLVRSRVRAFRSFRRALHVSLLVTQVFVFYESQLAGLVSLALNLCLLGAVNHVLRRGQGAAAGNPPPHAP
jgi:hypothetical protein